jgi:hypothetical protein
MVMRLAAGRPVARADAGYWLRAKRPWAPVPGMSGGHSRAGAACLLVVR